MKKRILTILLLGTMIITLLAGCGSKETSNDDVKNTQTTENSVTNEAMVDTEIETEIATEETEATEVETQTETTEQPTTTYTYEDMQATMYAKQSVNVRNLPSTDGEKLGALSYAQEVTVTGKCVETGWYRIDYNGSVGYVSNSYLVDEKPQEEQPVVPSEPSEPSQPNGRYGGVWNGTTYTNTTYNTSFSLPTLDQIRSDVELDIMTSREDVIYFAMAVDYDGPNICLKGWYEASSTRIGYTFSEAGLVEYLTSYPVTSAPAFFTRSEIYTTSIGGNTYYCGEVYDNRENSEYSELYLVRFSGNKLLCYSITGDNITIDTAKQYIAY